MSRRNKTDRALSIETEYALSGTRKRQYSTDRETNDSWQNDKAKRSRIDALEHRVNDMFPTIMERAGKGRRHSLSKIWVRFLEPHKVVKRLHASPVFSTLKVNPELNDLSVPTSNRLSKYDGVLGTITHGLLCQRKTLAEELKKLAVKFPSASEDIRNLLSDDSNFKTKSDDLLQYVCAHRAGAIDLRRKAFKSKNEALAAKDTTIASPHFYEDRLPVLLETMVKRKPIGDRGNKGSDRKGQRQLRRY
ncbi:hypothetical protein ACJJTC_010394 [Scirpophaga incertulas]